MYRAGLFPQPHRTLLLSCAVTGHLVSPRVLHLDGLPRALRHTFPLGSPSALCHTASPPELTHGSSSLEGPASMRGAPTTKATSVELHLGSDACPLCHFLFTGSEPPGAAHTRRQRQHQEVGSRASQAACTALDTEPSSAGDAPSVEVPCAAAPP